MWRIEKKNNKNSHIAITRTREMAENSFARFGIIPDNGNNNNEKSKPPSGIIGTTNRHAYRS